MVSGTGPRGRDLSRQIERNPKLLKEMDLKKGVRRPGERTEHEGIIDGVTNDSIAEFVASRDKPQPQSEPFTALERLLASFKSRFRG